MSLAEGTMAVGNHSFICITVFISRTSKRSSYIPTVIIIIMLLEK